MRISITAETRTEIISRYIAGDRPKNIAADLGINDWNISVIVRRAGCARSASAAQQLILSRGEWIGNRRYAVNHSAFSYVTTESAYWIGFLMADGCIIDNKVRLKLATQDRDHLEKFRAFIGTDAPIMSESEPAIAPTIGGRKIQGRGAVFVTVTSEQIVRDLSAFGVVPKKTEWGYARSYGVALNRDFWRGMIDGDGSLFRSRGKPFVSLVGNQYLMTQFLAFCKTTTNTSAKIGPSGNIFRVYLSSGPALAVITELYRNAAVALDRKAAKAAAIISGHG